MKKQITALLLLSISLGACKKDEPKQYSTWYVNGQKFHTNDVRTDEGKARHQIVANDLNNRFHLQFNLGYFPTDGQYLINCSQQNPAWCCLAISFNGNGYVDPENTYVQCGSVDNKATYGLPETWFYNVLDPSDSILVSGTFNEP